MSQEGTSRMVVKPAEMEQTQVDITKKGVDDNFKRTTSPFLVSKIPEIGISPENQQRFKAAMTPAIGELLAAKVIAGDRKSFEDTFKSAFKGATDEQVRAAYNLMLEEYTKKAHEAAKRIAPSITTKEDSAKLGAWDGETGHRFDEAKGTTGTANKFVFESAQNVNPELQGDCVRGALEAGFISKQDAEEIVNKLNEDNIAKKRIKKDDSEANRELLMRAVEKGVVERMSILLRTLADINGTGLDKEQEKQLEKEIAKDSGAAFLALAKKDIENFKESGKPGEYQPSKEMQILIELNAGNLNFVPSRVNR